MTEAKKNTPASFHMIEFMGQTFSKTTKIAAEKYRDLHNRVGELEAALAVDKDRAVGELSGEIDRFLETK